MKLSKLFLAFAVLSLAASCRAADADDEDDDMYETGDPILDAIAELAPGEFEEISVQISEQGQAPDSYIEAQAPSVIAALQAALAPFGLNAYAPAPELADKIDALSPEATLQLVENVGEILAASPDDDDDNVQATTGRKMK